ncbi:MAG: hypothetical protein ABGY24_15170 [bacterium]
MQNAIRRECFEAFVFLAKLDMANSNRNPRMMTSFQPVIVAAPDRQSSAWRGAWNEEIRGMTRPS